MVDQRFSASVHIMTYLAHAGCRDGRKLTSEQLAHSVRTNPTVVRRLVGRLAGAGLLKAQRGKTGGVELAVPPARISLKDIYLAASGKSLIQGPLKSPRRQCAVSCAMGELMLEVSEGVERNSMRYLAGIKLADLAAKVKD